MDKNAKKLSMLLGMPLKATKGKTTTKEKTKPKGKKNVNRK